MSEWDWTEIIAWGCVVLLLVACRCERYRNTLAKQLIDAYRAEVEALMNLHDYLYRFCGRCGKENLTDTPLCSSCFADHTLRSLDFPPDEVTP